MIIKFTLGLFFSALVCLIAADLLNHFALHPLATLLIPFGDALLLASFLIWLLILLKVFAKTIVTQMANYFSKQQRAQRHLLFTLIQADNLQRLFQSKKKQLAYFHALKYKRLVAKDTVKQSRLLEKSLQKQLMQCKPQLAPAQFATYQQQLKQAARSHDIDQLIELQHKISTHLTS
jgi:hypothetical protein